VAREQRIAADTQLGGNSTDLSPVYIAANAAERVRPSTQGANAGSNKCRVAYSFLATGQVRKTGIGASGDMRSDRFPQYRSKTTSPHREQPWRLRDWLLNTQIGR
jgi:hypothetical protein